MKLTYLVIDAPCITCCHQLTSRLGRPGLLHKVVKLETSTYTELHQHLILHWTSSTIICLQW